MADVAPLGFERFPIWENPLPVFPPGPIVPGSEPRRVETVDPLNAEMDRQERREGAPQPRGRVETGVPGVTPDLVPARGNLLSSETLRVVLAMLR